MSPGLLRPHYMLPSVKKSGRERARITSVSPPAKPAHPCTCLQNLMVHVGFQSLYTLESAQGGESPKETIHRLIKEHKPTLDKVTVVGHSLGGGESEREYATGGKIRAKCPREKCCKTAWRNLHNGVVKCILNGRSAMQQISTVAVGKRVPTYSSVETNV